MNPRWGPRIRVNRPGSPSIRLLRYVTRWWFTDVGRLLSALSSVIAVVREGSLSVLITLSGPRCAVERGVLARNRFAEVVFLLVDREKSRAQVTQGHGRRESAATAFLHSVTHRPNLTVITDAHATRIL